MTDHLTQSAAAQSAREAEPDVDRATTRKTDPKPGPTTGPKTGPMTDTAPLVAIRQADGSLSCPHCGAEVAAAEAFCEACGGRLAPTARGPAEQSDEMAAPID